MATDRFDGEYEAPIEKGSYAMEKTVSSRDAPERFGDLPQGIADKGDRYVVERDGVPFAVVVPFALYAQWKRGREEFFRRMRETAECAAQSESEAVRIVDEAKRAVRLRS